MLRLVYLAAFSALAVVYYYGFGPGPDAADLMEESLPWWKTTGFVPESLRTKGLADMVREGWPVAGIPIGLFLAPPLALFIATLATFKNAIARAFALFLALGMGAFVWWGYMNDEIWRFLGWRFPAVMLSCAALIAAVTYGPSLLRLAIRTSMVVAALALLAFVGVVFALSTEVTGTDPWMPFNISPWPFVTLVGFMFWGLTVGALHVAAGIGALLGKRLSGATALPAGALLAGVVAAALTPWILERPPLGAFVVLFVGGALYGLFAARSVLRRGDDATPAGVRAFAGIVICSAILASHQASVLFQVAARNDTATEVLVALEKYKVANDTYPDTLEELVPAQLGEVPRPRIGLWLHEGDAFTYSNFGDSYALEFASVLWVQCQYSPPYEYASYEDEEEEESGASVTPDVAAPARSEDPKLRAMLAERGLDGSWSCEEAPPKFW